LVLAAARGAPNFPRSLHPSFETVLARANRVIRADDYRSTVRQGRRVSTEHATVYVRRTNDHSTVRFGFIVAKPVGIAVQRNLVRRRLKSIAAENISFFPPGTDIVVRALPGAAQASWTTLNTEITEVLSKGMARA